MLWIVGKISRDYSEYFAEHHIPYGIFADKTLGNEDTAAVSTVKTDFSSETSLLHSVSEISVGQEVTALVVAGYEHYVLPAAILAEYFKVPGPSRESALAATDKAVMRECFKKFSPDMTPDFTLVTTWEDAEHFMAKHSYPVILKPTNLMKSLFVTKNNSLEQLKENYEKMATALPAHYETLGVGLRPGILLEEFLAGTMHTVAGFADKNGNISLAEPVVDCATAQDIGINDSYLFSRSLPSKLSAVQQQHILDVAKQGMEALGLRSVPAHIEVMLTATGPRIIEIGARIGGYRPRMYEYAYGMDLYDAALAVASGKQPVLSPVRSESSCAIELFPAEEGAFSEVEGAEELKTLPSLKYFSVKRKPGDVIGPARDGYRATAVVLLSHNSSEQVIRDTALIQEHVSVNVSS